MKYVDLHTHTKASDGLHDPADNVRMAQEAGLAAIAITDHDTVSGLQEAIEEGKRLGITVVPGVEMSTVAKGQDIHILGYYINFNNEQFLKQLEQLRETRNQRNDMIIHRLRELGFDITIDEVREGITAVDETVGRPHIADVLVKKGYVSSMKEAFDKYLGKNGKAYMNPERIHPIQAIEWIHQAGGSAVIAHPGLYHDDALVEEMIQHGIDGLEVYHADHSPADEQRYLGIATKNNLIITAGSDFHGERQGEIFHAPIGSKKINLDVIEKLKKS